MSARARHRPLLLGVDEIVFAGHALAQRPARSLLQHLVHFPVRKLQEAAHTDPTGDFVEKGSGQIRKVGLDFILFHFGGEETDAAIYVVTHTAGRNHAIRLAAATTPPMEKP